MPVKRQRVYVGTPYVDILGEVCQEKGIPVFELLELIIDEFTTEMLKELVDDKRERGG
tara:strand:- start:1686 stop:1859 length:174 start_codon:yes stop_codon:yes gene_type:complete